MVSAHGMGRGRRRLFSRTLARIIPLLLLLGSAALLLSARGAGSDAARPDGPLQGLVDPGPSGASQGSVPSAAFDRERGEWVLTTEQIAVSLTVDGEDPGKLSIVSRPSGQVVVDRSRPAIVSSGHRYRLTEGTARPDAGQPTRVDVPGFGPGLEIEVPFDFSDGQSVTVALTLLERSPGLLLRLRPSTEGPDGSTYTFLDGHATFLLGDGAEYLTDASEVRSGVVHDDGLAVDETVDFGKPVVLWGGALPSAVLIATVDETDVMSGLRATLPTGQVLGQLRYRSGRSRPMSGAPRMYLEVTGEARPGDAFRHYREAMAQLYPTKAAPSWVRYQWSTWYPHGLDYTERDVESTIDYIAANLSDLGPWHIVMDAGWFVAEGRPGSDFRTIDRAKFPRGIRPVVDYAHSHGVRVVLYLSVPYVDSRRQSGDWVGLRGLVNAERSCLVPLDTDPTRTSYIFDFQQRCTHVYWETVLREFFTSYDVDGIIMDGLGAAEGAEITPGSREPFGLVDSLTKQSVSIYRFMDETARRLKPDAYIESEWHMPMMAKPYSTTFRLADSSEDFSHPYPYTGVLEDVDYAAFQRQALDQRYHMGWTMGNANGSKVDTWRREAALSLQGLVGEGIDLHSLTADGLTALRAQLALQKPFEGKTVVDDPRRPAVVGTERDGLLFVGMINREKSPARITGSLDSFGPTPDQPYTVYTPDDDTARLERGTIENTLAGESFHLDVLARQAGVVWTESSFHQQKAGSRLEVSLNGPARSNGFAVVYAPGLRSATLDDQPLKQGSSGKLSALSPGEYHYDSTTGILRLRYTHDRPHVLRVDLAGS